MKSCFGWALVVFACCAVVAGAEAFAPAVFAIAEFIAAMVIPILLFVGFFALVYSAFSVRWNRVVYEPPSQADWNEYHAKRQAHKASEADALRSCNTEIKADFRAAVAEYLDSHPWADAGDAEAAARTLYNFTD